MSRKVIRIRETNSQGISAKCSILSRGGQIKTNRKNCHPEHTRENTNHLEQIIIPNHSLALPPLPPPPPRRRHHRHHHRGSP